MDWVLNSQIHSGEFDQIASYHFFDFGADKAFELYSETLFLILLSQPFIRIF